MADIENKPEKEDIEIGYEVTFDGLNDKEDATQLSTLRKWLIVVIISLGSTCITCLSSCWTLASTNIINHFGVSEEVSVLGISLFIIAVGCGGVFLAPMSEYYGRKKTYTIGLFLCGTFNLLPGFCENFGGVLFGRFVSGFFASSFMAVASGTFADIFPKDKLAYPVALYTMSPFVGPGLGPLMSGFINKYIDFRWTFHVMTIWCAVIVVMVVLFVPETYQPVLLMAKAKRVRKETGDDRYYAPLEKSKRSLVQAILLSCERPIGLLFRDKMTFVLCFYTGFNLAIVYMFFVAVPYIFETVYGFEIDHVGLTFIGLILGMAISSLVGPFFVTKYMNKKAAANKGIMEPEFRFFSIEIGVFIAPMGLLVMGWTAYPHVHWMGPIIGMFIFGFGIIFIFNGIFGYTVDAYRLYAASAMATNSLVRSIMGGVFPLFGKQMYKKMGIHWASTFLALIGCLLIPVAFLFAKHGPRLRQQSKYAWA
ncbi:hypothetical protein PSN45_001262 [Yamadazyma tenuis]|uniref:Major facilitator superfamily (MFS) profile domain-containing protein n=1 Tax=Candida tenuis (strain ATCC 10573 / BCRC 21748 / CBS 615 / JCM 9827 / NBRC 10315 / NRRL Y-1498 / VKM Y-70) TaxID=590646 RepID=G3BDE0_CANTC|nr:uncharacterized protein CANTEDRAFT_128736 [Yamadazyma tenuis ATCC 10573]EGV60935.1 hypothetical protein CANTEDRAFT_128736 [Yamadazyma tenuis ATCC 10573]WEJ93787.1 hypothetical protein PSN45_001262 [Yamadazyma tenuis]